MGKKYIIELEDKPFHKGNGDFLYRVKGFNSLVFDMTGVGKLTPYTEPDLEQVRKDAYEEGKKQAKVQAELDVCHDIEKVAKGNYQQGLNDAWEAARKIWEYDTATLRKIFGKGVMRMDWFMKFTASEAIEKLKAYEQKQEEELGIQGYFKNGEEVIDANGTKAVILRVSEDNYCQVYTENGCIENWHIHTYKFHKTGRTFPEIAAVLEKMRKGQDG